MSAREVNFDGIVGPTHNYAGLSHGNVASLTHKGRESKPREAVLQGLRKMKAVRDLGVLQAVLPPHARPEPETLRKLGFSGSDHEVLALAATQAPILLAASASASAMWTANAATVSPSADTSDGRMHFTPANLEHQFHRSQEGLQTQVTLQSIFDSEDHFVVHDPLPCADAFGDEGAANHGRLCAAHGEPGVEMFVYGRSAFAPDDGPKRYPARQTKEACEAIARRHGLKSAVLLQQSPDAIDAGAFHNDVVSVANQNVLLYQKNAFHDPGAIKLLRRNLGCELIAVEVPISIEDAVASYLFNSQLITTTNGMTLVAPKESEKFSGAIDAIIDGPSPINAVEFLDVRQSMDNGGGPACLRLRVVLTDDERRAIKPGVMLDDALLDNLTGWANTFYRETLTFADLSDPSLLDESRRALDALTQLLAVGSIYAFQR